MLKGCAAAASCNLDAEICELGHGGGKILGSDIEDSSAVFFTGESCIRVDDHGNGGGIHETLYDWLHLMRAERAVDAESIHMKAFEKRNNRLDTGACQKLAVAVKGGGGKDRKITVLSGGKNGSLDFIGVIHGFDENQIGTAGSSDADNLCEDINRLFKGEITKGLQKLSGGADVKRNIGILFTAAVGSCFLCKCNCRRDDFLQLIGVFQNVGTKGIGVDDAAAGLQKAGVQIRDDIRMRQIPELRQFTAPEAAGLKIGSGSTVTENPFFAKLIS